MVWLTICLVLLFGVIASFVFSIKGGMIGDGDYLTTGLSMANVENPIQKNDEANETMFRVLAWVSIVLTLVLFVVILFMKKKVNICVGIMREASHCLRAIPLLILWPLVPYFLFLALLVYWVVVGAFVASAGEISVAKMLALTNSTLLQQASAASASLANATSAAVPASLQTLDSSKLRQYLGLYHFFGLLWTNAVIQALSMCTVAGVVSKYYWARDKTAKRAFGASPIRSSFWVCLRYHFGSLCFGALIIAVCQFVRAILAYVDHKTKGLQRSNILIKVFMKAIQCCMCCLERLLKYISKSAYVIVAMQGVSFCAATKTAFSLIFANLAQIATSNSIVSFMLLLAKVAITAGCSLLFYFVVDADPAYSRGGARELSNPAVPLALCGLVAFFVGSTFMNLYGMVVDTILLLFCVDKRENKGKDGGYFMSDELARLLGEKNNSQKAAAAAAAAAAASKAEEEPSTTTDPGAGEGKGAGAVKLQEVDA
jgi:choline transporter-like protein 2/4/5